MCQGHSQPWFRGLVFLVTSPPLALRIVLPPLPGIPRALRGRIWQRLRTKCSQGSHVPTRSSCGLCSHMLQEKASLRTYEYYRMLPGVTVWLCSFSRIMWLSLKLLAYLRFTSTASHSRPGPVPGSSCQYKMKSMALQEDPCIIRLWQGFLNLSFLILQILFVYIMASSFVSVKDSVCANTFLCMCTSICAFSLALSSVCLFCPSLA